MNVLNRIVALGVSVMAALILPLPAFAQISVTDDRGAQVELVTPAQRIITLTPHATELVYAAGGGARIVATVNASDYPADARALPRIGDGLSPEPERLLKLRPDLLIGWQRAQLPELARIPLATFLSAPQSLDAIADTIEKLGVLLATSDVADQRAQALRKILERLSHLPPISPPVRVFLQVGEPPEYSLNRTHLLSQVIEACGGLNVFGAATAIAPKISDESVLALRPELILLGRTGASATPTIADSTRQYWARLKVPAAQTGKVFVMDSDVLYRPGPRLIEAAESICSMIQQARK